MQSLASTPDNEWASVPPEEALRLLGTNIDGLSEEEAERRLKEHGLNKLTEKPSKSPLTLFLEQFKSILVVILLVAAGVSAYLAIAEGEPLTDTYVILVILMLNAVLGFVQEYRAEKAVEALKKMINPRSVTVRGGEERSIDSSLLVPGDIVKLEAGDRIPADLRVVESYNLMSDEAILTGESFPVAKSSEAVSEERSEKTCLLFMGTVLTSGRAISVVTRTGMKTVFGNIADMVQSTPDEEPPINRKVEVLGRQLGVISVALCILVFVMGFWIYNLPLEQTLLTAISLAVSAIPEGLPAVLTITMALGVAAIARQKAIVKKLASVETLGSTTVICSDKTGTITKNEMTVRRINLLYRQIEVTGSGYEPTGEYLQEKRRLQVSDDPLLELALRIGVQCNSSNLIKENDKWVVYGDPTEGALTVAGAKAGLKRMNCEDHKLLTEYSFDSIRKRMSVVYRLADGSLRSYVKGAPEELLRDCITLRDENETRPLAQMDREYFSTAMKQMAAEALRVIGLAYRDYPAGSPVPPIQEAEKGLTFLGLTGIIDPPREEAKEAIAVAKRAGIRPVMLTGDHVLTAKAIAKQVGILDHEAPNSVLVGDYIDELSDEQLDSIVDEIRVCARVSPQHKTRIALALKKRGHIVAMTGDGVNDAPALKAADIGVAMGIKGTDVTKEAATMILEDDNFATIVKAVEGGRRIYSNITKYVRLMLCANFDEFLLILATISLGLPVPFLPVQVLWINLVTDGLPAVALSNDPGEKGLMDRPPRDPREGLLDRFWVFIAFASLVAFVADFIPFYLVLGWTGDLSVARSVCVTSIVLFELALTFQVRSETLHIFSQGWEALTSNPSLLVAVVASLLLQMGALYYPPLSGVLKMVPLSLEQLGLTFAAAGSALLIVPRFFIKPQKIRKI
jgi:P-type Ca2+ transporter type 2C